LPADSPKAEASKFVENITPSTRTPVEEKEEATALATEAPVAEQAGKPEEVPSAEIATSAETEVCGLAYASMS
jgi:hypothetical protein